MEPEPKKARRVVEEDGDGVDRISCLPDDLIYHIFSFLNAKFAVQSGILSNRWKNLWKTLPHLNFKTEGFSRFGHLAKFIDKFLSKRDHLSNIDTVNYYNYGILNPSSVKWIMSYAIAHNVKHLYIKSGSGSRKTIFPISLFESQSLEKLTLDTADIVLTNLSRYAWCLPALKELKIFECELSLSSSSWSLPALTSLDLTGIMFSEFNVVKFSGIVNLKRLSLCNCNFELETFDISSDKLEHLIISNDKRIYDEKHILCFRTCKFVLSTPKLSCFIFQGSYPIIIIADVLDCVVKVFMDYIVYDIGSSVCKVQQNESKQIAQRIIDMFKVFSHAQCLVLSSGVIKVLSRVRYLLKSQVSPFYNLKSLKLQKEYIISVIPSHVESYLLSNLHSSTKSSMIDVEYRTVAVNIGHGVPLSALVDQLDKNGNADVSAIGAKEARKFTWGYQFWSLVTTKSNVKGKEIVPKATDKGPVVKNKDFLCRTTKILSKASTKVLVEDIESFVGDARDGVERHVKVLADSKESSVVDEYADVGIRKDKFVKSGLGSRVEEGGGQQSGGGAVLVTGETMVVSECLPAQMNVACRETEGASKGAKGVGTSTLVAGNVEQMSYSQEAENLKLLLGNVVDKEMLALIKRKYPETFYGFTPQSEMIRTVGLNTLCTALKTLYNVCTAEVTVAKIAEYQNSFADLEGWGFNLGWLVKHLNSVEQLRFSRPLVDELALIDRNLQEAQREVQRLMSLRAAKMEEIKEVFGQFGTTLAAGRIGDMLFENH